MAKDWKWEDEAASLTGAVLILSIAIAVWIGIKATELVVRVMTEHPSNRPMVAAIGLLVFLCGLAVLTQGRNGAVNVLAALSFLTLLFTAKAVELYYDPMVQVEVSKEYLLNEVLNEPWFST